MARGGGGSGGRSAGGRHPDQASGQPGAACAPLGEQEPPPSEPTSGTASGGPMDLGLLIAISEIHGSDTP